MTAANLTQTAAFALDLPHDLIRLAAPIVADHLAISVAEAEQQLRQGRVRMADGPAAARLLPLLRAMGLHPELHSDQGVMMAIQTSSAACTPLLAANLARVLNRDATAVLAALQSPGGIILDGITQDQTDDLHLRLRALRGLRLTLGSGAFDLFAISPLQPETRRKLGPHLAILGLRPCRFSGALAANLTALQANQLRSRFDDAGLLTLNRAFQRFDLFLTGTDGLAAQDAAAFLSTRADLGNVMVECVTPLSPLQIETGLTRTAARQFHADYAAIGLDTCARLARF